MTRVLHIVRTSLPSESVVEPGDRVVYTRAARPPASPDNSVERTVWLAVDAIADESHVPVQPTPRTGELIDSRALCRLAFEYDRVVVW